MWGQRYVGVQRCGSTRDVWGPGGVRVWGVGFHWV